jgi:hypothetical protein
VEDRARTPLVVGVLALVALLLRGVVPAPSSPETVAAASSRPPSPAPAEAPPADAAVCILRGFLGSAHDDRPLRLDEPLDGPLGAYTVESLIALLPHPTRSRLSAVFDAHVQALQRALEDADYLLDRYWLPWAVGKGGETGDARELRTPCGERAADDSPGVLLFRGGGASADRKLLLVLLVPESPRSGVDAPALRAALRVAAWSHGSRPAPKGALGVRILGPTFSGSVGSLKRALASWLGAAESRAARIELDIVSGSLTDHQSALELRSREDYPPDVRERIVVRFHTTVHSDEYVQRLFFNYLQNRDRSRPGTACPTEVPESLKISERVALLVESSTAYGRSILSGRERRTAEGYLTIPFPMHIGQLRAEWNKAAAGREVKAGTPVEIPLEVLDLPTEEARSGQDVLPPFSNLTSRIDNLILAQILPTLTRNRIQYVGLVATDVQDRLFLGKMVRRYCPDVTLFALGSDLVYAHPQYASALEGMLLASTYPLFTDNQAWTYPHRGHHERLQFPTNEAQGVFNAALALVDPHLMMEYGLPLQASDAESQGRQPPVWVSAVGRNGVWPVAALCLRDGPDPILFEVPADSSEASAAAHTGHPVETTFTSPTFFKVYALAFVLLCVLHAAAYFTLLGQRPRWGPLWRLFAILQPSRAPDRAFVQHLYLFGSFLILSLVYAWISVPLALRARVDVGYDSSVLLETGVLVLGWLALLAPMIDIARWCRAAFRNMPGKLASMAAVVLSVAPLALLVTTVVYAFGSWTDFLNGTPVERAWVAAFYLRSTTLGSGLSPLLPLLFLGLALYLWSLCELRRLHLGESARDHSAIATMGGPEAPGLDVLKRRADGLLEDSFRNLKTCFALIGVGTAFFWITLKWLPPSLDGRYFVRLFEVLLFFVSVAIAFEFARFVLCWRCLRAMLRRFAWLPASPGLKRVPVLISSEPVIDLARAGPGLATLRVALGRWEALAAAWKAAVRDEAGPADPFAKALGPDLDEARVEMEHALRAEVSSGWAVEDARRRLQAQVDAAQLVSAQALRERGAAGAPWREAAEDFLAMGIVGYIRYSLAHLRNLLAFATGASLLVLLAISSYPFQPAHLLLALSWIAILTLVGTTIVIFVQMDRDEVLSWLAKSTPGHLVFSREFLGRVATYGLMPLLGVTAAQFPDVGRVLFFWVEPFLGALK